jgi:hypothetical protein
VAANIVQVQKSGTYTVLVIAAGTSAGIKAGSTGTVVDAGGQPIPGSDFVVNSKDLSASECIATTSLPPTAITSMKVEITP